MTAPKLDKLDLRILTILQENGRITNQDLAAKVNLSPSSCLQRVRRLEKSKFIHSYQAGLNLDRIARHINCIAAVTVKDHTQQEFKAFVALIESIPEIVECFTVSGESDFLVKIICADMNRYLEISDLLLSSNQQQVTINTYVVMKENKRFRGVDLSTLQGHAATDIE